MNTTPTLQQHLVDHFGTTSRNFSEVPEFATNPILLGRAASGTHRQPLEEFELLQPATRVSQVEFSQAIADYYTKVCGVTDIDRQGELGMAFYMGTGKKNVTTVSVTMTPNSVLVTVMQS